MIFPFHLPALGLVSLKKALKSDWLLCFAVPFSLAEKRGDLEQKIARFVKNSRL